MESRIDLDLVRLYASWPLEARIDHAVAAQEMYLELHHPFRDPEILFFDTFDDFAAYHRSEAWLRRIYGGPRFRNSAGSSMKEG